MAKGNLRKKEFIWAYGLNGEGDMAAGDQNRKSGDHIFNFKQKGERKLEVEQSYNPSKLVLSNLSPPARPLCPFPPTVPPSSLIPESGVEGGICYSNRHRWDCYILKWVLNPQPYGRALIPQHLRMRTYSGKKRGSFPQRETS